MSSGLFITLEGGEGAGKSTQIQRLAAHLGARGHQVITTREPGGSPGAEAIRSVLLDTGAMALDATTEALLFAAARRGHVRATIRPALKAGHIVLCDRFIDSTRAYQGAGGDLSRALIRRLETLAIGRTRPDLTIILDLDPATGMARAASRRGAALATSDRFERRGVDFHAAVRAEFLAIAVAEPRRCAVVDAARGPDAVFADLVALVDTRLAGRAR